MHRPLVNPVLFASESQAELSRLEIRRLLLRVA